VCSGFVDCTLWKDKVKVEAQDVDIPDHILSLTVQSGLETSGTVNKDGLMQS